MLCPSCRRQLERGARVCGRCGASLTGGEPALELVLRDGARVPLVDTLTLGRAPGNSIQIDDRTVSRQHARIELASDGAFIEDAGSSHGTYLDGRRLEARSRLRGGMTIQLGDAMVSVERRSDGTADEATIFVPVGASVVLRAAGQSELDAVATAYGFHPRVRSGWALKRLDESEGPRRWVLKDLRRGDFVRMGDDEAALFEALDGASSLQDLIAEAERRFGPGGPGRLARLLADLGERGLLSGVERRSTYTVAPGWLARAFQPRELIFERAPRFFERSYERGGFVLFTRAARTLLTVIAVAGIVAFAFLVARRYGTPFVVASKVGLGGLVFLLGRLALVSLHELAHGLTVVSFGRRVARAGLKLVLVFPYAFVDTSDAWFEPRRRRIEISAAGPFSDTVCGGVAGLVALALSAGTLRDILFQLAFAAYVGALFNLNPFLERDGYHILVDVLREPGLRRRSRDALGRALRGEPALPGERRALTIYGWTSLAWSIVAAGFVVVLGLRYQDALDAIAPAGVVWGLFAALALLMLLPLASFVGRPVADRLRSRSAPTVRADF